MVGRAVLALTVAQPKRNIDDEIAGLLALCYADPLAHVMLSYPWESERSIQLVRLPKDRATRFDSEFGPDGWACDFLDRLGEEVLKRGFNGRDAVEPIRFSTASGHGIGKSVLVAWLIKFIMDTRPFCKGVVTATTAEQLRTKTWAELGKWHKMSLTKHWFEYNSGRGSMSLTHKQHKETWRCDAQTSREENSESFAGLHAANSTPFYIFDEASGVPPKIFEVREGGTTDGEPMIFDFGNPTRNSGNFFENTVGRFKHRYIVQQIDSRSVEVTNKRLIQQWVDDYGEDDDFVRVRVRGLFPSQGSTQFIPTDLVEEAMRRELANDRNAPLLIGVDVARFGDDDSVIFCRVGSDCRSWPAKRFKGLDTVQLVGRVIETIREFRQLGKPVSGLFVDGTGIGGGVVDQLRHLGYGPIEVQFGSKPTDPQTYRYKSDEMWGTLKEALPRLCLPAINQVHGSDLRDQLTMREFGYTQQGHKIHLERKEDMKDRGLPSPDLADALALTFAQEVSTIASEHLGEAQSAGLADYDPLTTKW